MEEWMAGEGQDAGAHLKLSKVEALPAVMLGSLTSAPKGGKGTAFLPLPTPFSYILSKRLSQPMI